MVTPRLSAFCHLAPLMVNFGNFYIPSITTIFKHILCFISGANTLLAYSYACTYQFLDEIGGRLQGCACRVLTAFPGLPGLPVRVMNNRHAGDSGPAITLLDALTGTAVSLIASFIGISLEWMGSLRDYVWLPISQLCKKISFRLSMVLCSGPAKVLGRLTRVVSTLASPLVANAVLEVEVK